MKPMTLPSLGSTLAGGITGAAGLGTTLSGATSGSSFMSEMQGVQADMQKNAVVSAKMDAQNQHINAIAKSAAEAGSAATQVAINY
ncbi:hypothetical protein [Serratia ficaria]|uniref:hypothetical protein n=1 Tax=Serratia ficaria TaxID=61651 RepID=UPI00077C77EB|nr:hypothetical protein [Serratia ficaria]